MGLVVYQENATSRGLFPIFASLPGDSQGNMLQNSILCCKALSDKKVGPNYVPWCHCSVSTLAREKPEGFHNL